MLVTRDTPQALGDYVLFPMCKWACTRPQVHFPSVHTLLVLTWRSCPSFKVLVAHSFHSNSSRPHVGPLDLLAWNASLHSTFSMTGSHLNLCVITTALLRLLDSTPKASTDLLYALKGENKKCSHLVGTNEVISIVIRPIFSVLAITATTQHSHQKIYLTCNMEGLICVCRCQDSRLSSGHSFQLEDAVILWDWWRGLWNL